MKIIPAFIRRTVGAFLGGKNKAAKATKVSSNRKATKAEQLKPEATGNSRPRRRGVFGRYADEKRRAVSADGVRYYHSRTPLWRRGVNVRHRGGRIMLLDPVR
jgi:hypothetical protein